MTKLLAIPTIDRMQEFEELMNKYSIGLEYNDFFLPSILDSDELEKRIVFYQKYKNVYTTMHGVFFDIIVHSYDRRIQEVSKKRVEESIEIAKKLGCKKIVFHTNLDPNLTMDSYRRNWLEKNTEFYKALARNNPELEIVLENMFDESPYPLEELISNIHEPNVRICLDIAHANLSNTAISEWISVLRPWISHLHVNDNMGDSDTHSPVGKGNIPYEQYMDILNDPSITVLLEVKSLEDFVESLENLKMRGFNYEG